MLFVGESAQPGAYQAASRRNGATAERPLNPADARNTDSCLPMPPAQPVEHNYACEDPAPGNLWFRWIHGSPVAAKNADPRIQVMQYNEDTYVLRQNICVDWRGPFTYLLFGNNGALLIDTGATAQPELYPLRQIVDGVIARWLTIRRRNRVPLTVAFTSHENRDQNAGAAQFTGREEYRVAPGGTAEIRRFYGMENVGGTTGQIDLGGRVVDVIATPGTHRDGLTFYDRYTRHLFTGDLLFPGRISIANEADFLASLERLQQWKKDHPVKWVLGGGIDMQFLPGRAYGRFATFKPYERELQMRHDVIDTAVKAAREAQGKRTVLVRSDFWLLNGVGPDERPDSFPEDLPNINTPRPV